MSFKQFVQTESNYDLNLAPFLDIIVAVVPMLLLSVAFMQVKMIETPVPQVVAQASENAQKEDKVEITLEASKQAYTFVIKDKGQTRTVKAEGTDPEALYKTALDIKRQHPHVLDLSLNPTGDVALNELVKTMDSVRKLKPEHGQVAFLDPKTGQNVQTDFMFPNVIFGNIVGE